MSAATSKPGEAARAAALDLLTQVFDAKRPLDDAIAASKRMAALEPRDRAVARRVTATVLRRRGQIDDVIARALDRPLPRRAHQVRQLLRVGTAELLFLDTPAHAAVDTAVALAREHGFERLTGLVNAILRRLTREGAAWVEHQDAPRLNTPAWLWESWVSAYGEPTARAIATAHLDEPPLDFSVARDPRHWADQLGAEIWPTGTLRRRGGGLVSELPGYESGQWWVQDAAAALPVRLFGDIAGKAVIDLCAAPGGKTAQLAAAGARVTAIDRSARRLSRLGENLARLGLDATCAIGDGTTWRPPTPVDAVLLDAPCTATGTIRRHPDIPWLKSARDVATMATVQDSLLRAAVEMVRPGGLVVYCTCSLQPEEGPDRIAALLDSGAPVNVEPVHKAEVNGLDELILGPFLRTLPCHLAERGGMDGFFAARLRRAGG